MAIGSNYYEDLSKVEKQIFHVPLRQFKAGFLLALTLIPLTLEAIVLPNGLFYLLAPVTAAILEPYPCLLMVGKWPKYRRKIQLYFLKEDSSYYAGTIRRYPSSEFKQKKTVHEANQNDK